MVTTTEGDGMKEESEKQIAKLTFEAVQSAQEQLCAKLYELIEEKRCIKNVEEKNLFMKLLGYATLGLGTNTKALLSTSGGVKFRVNVEWVARWSANQTENRVFIPQDLNLPVSGDSTPNAEMVDVWKCVLHYLYNVFPKALDRSMSMSKERESKTGESSFVIPDE